MTGNPPISIALNDSLAIGRREGNSVAYGGVGAHDAVMLDDCNFHESVMYDGNNPEEKKKVEECVKRMVERAIEMEGTCTGEHGIGLGKKQSLVKELGLDAIGVMQKVKMALDPLWLMNPGKVFDHPANDHPIGK